MAKTGLLAHSHVCDCIIHTRRADGAFEEFERRCARHATAEPFEVHEEMMQLSFEAEALRIELGLPETAEMP